jgi:ESX secretion-associated protein EspD/H
LDSDGREDMSALDFSSPDAYEGDEVPVPVFAVTNPPGTVTVTTFMDGRVKQIDLSAGTTDMTEPELADEIVVIAGLATQEAKSAQYAFMLEGMREQGHDDVATRDFLSRDLDLPTPDQAREARAQLFATRYSGDHV